MTEEAIPLKLFKKYKILKGILREKKGAIVLRDDNPEDFQQWFNLLLTDYEYNEVLIVYHKTDFVSQDMYDSIVYEEFANSDKISNLKLNQYKLVVFYDSNKLAYYKNPQTKRLIKLRFPKCSLVFVYEKLEPFKRMVYIMRKCGAFGKRDMASIWLNFYGKITNNYTNQVYFTQENTVALNLCLYPILVYNEPPKEYEHYKYAPSSLAIYSQCPGAFYMKRRQPHYHYAAFKGHTHHYFVEYMLNEYKKEGGFMMPVHEQTLVCELLTELGLIEYIRHCAECIKNNKQYGIETHLKHPTIADFGGYCDFWSYDKDTRTIEVCDFKSGKIYVPVQNNIQLIAYSILAQAVHNLDVDHIRLTIFSGLTKSTIFYENSLQKMIDKVTIIIDNIKSAAKNPYDFLSNECSSPYCPAYEVHLEREQKRKETK